MKPEIIAIIPARGGSKGIPRKNIRLLAGKPLISYVIRASEASKYIDRVVVSTEDKEIEEIAKFYGAEVVKRPEELAGDSVPLDPVIYHALNSIEQKEQKRYEFVLTIQPTSPLLTCETIDSAIEIMINQCKNQKKAPSYNTLISVKAEPHLYWTKTDGDYCPLYKTRKNRQYLDPIYKETGSILISHRDSVTENSRIGDKLFLFEVPSGESIDIDSYQDWMLAENLMNKKKILFRVVGDTEIGLGHIYRAITLANRFIFNNDVFFLLNNKMKVGVQKVQESCFPVITFENEAEMFEKIKEIKPDIVINDILDTDKKYILRLKQMGYFTVNFEDLGEGSDYADLVINSLYEYTCPASNHYFGHNYVCLRDEFYIIPPKKSIDQVKRIMITFGGTDPNNLTLRTLKAIRNLGLKEIQMNVVLGLGYIPKEELYAYVDSFRAEGFDIKVKENVSMIAQEIYNADLVLTSNGRTIYEVTSIGTPFISISQNERESMHLFVHHLKGVMYLGMAYRVSEEDISIAIRTMVEKPELRRRINENLLRVDLRGGINMVQCLIFDKYEEWKKNERINN